MMCVCGKGGWVKLLNKLTRKTLKPVQFPMVTKIYCCCCCCCYSDVSKVSLISAASSDKFLYILKIFNISSHSKSNVDL